MVDTLERYPQPLQPYLDMIEGQRMDLLQHRYASFSELELYCYRVAGTVGLMTQEVMGVDPAYTTAPWSERPDTSEAAVALGIANQLTNILRDVGEDRGRGRIYLPLDDLKQFNYSEAELLAGTLNDNWRALMAFQLERARYWFARSEAGVRWLAPDARWPAARDRRPAGARADAFRRLGQERPLHRFLTDPGHAHEHETATTIASPWHLSVHVHDGDLDRPSHHGHRAVGGPRGVGRLAVRRRLRR
jgi:phytoene synthase